MGGTYEVSWVIILGLLVCLLLLLFIYVKTMNFIEIKKEKLHREEEFVLRNKNF